MHTAHGVEILMVLLLVAAGVGFALKWVKLPYSIALVIVGLLIGSANVFPKVEMTPELILFVCLPALLFEAAWNIRLSEILKNRWPILVLATVGVVISMFLTGFMMHKFTGLQWHAALLFGALTAATDPISVLALFRKLGLDKRLNLLLEGESLFNDGTAVVLFKMVLTMALVGGTVNPVYSVFEFTKVVVIGAIVGLLVGFAASRITRFFDDHLLEITLTTIVAYGSYLVAEQLHSSAVIAVVVAGIVVGNYGSRTGMSATTRLAVNSFWEYAAFVTNSLVFLLIGLQINLGLLHKHAMEIVVAVGAIMISRFVVVYAFAPMLSTKRRPIPWNWRHLLFWGALRGSLSMALVLSLPLTFPLREQLVVLTFGVVLFTLIVPGLTIEPLVHALGMMREDRRIKAFQKLRGELFAEAQAFANLENLYKKGVITQKVYSSLYTEVTERQKLLNHKMEALNLKHSFIEKLQLAEARKHLLECKKDSLLQLVREEAGDPEVIEELVVRIDQELDSIYVEEREISRRVAKDHRKHKKGEALGPDPLDEYASDVPHFGSSVLSEADDEEADVDEDTDVDGNSEADGESSNGKSGGEHTESAPGSSSSDSDSSPKVSGSEDSKKA